MKKHIKVIRSADQTVVIYRDPPKDQKPRRPAKQKPVPVYEMGKFKYHVMSSGRLVYPRRYLLGIVPLPYFI